ncbi:MAG: rhodanese-like domain-containing protein [Planctomycetota bacterium]
MLAIPSPDVLMNLFASCAQVLGLLALTVGGGWMSRRRLAVDGALQPPSSRWPFGVACALLCAVSAAFLLYHLHVVDVRNARLQANLLRSSKENGKAVGDTSLKTLAYSDQVQHPRGVPTEQLAAWIAAGRDLNLVDVREPEEVEMGAIAGSWARRYPDLQASADGLVAPGRDTVLMCESGNRSSELCEYFAGRGLDTFFLVGGYEKWAAEDRPMTGERADGDEIRATPDYPQKNLLLDTPEVVRLFTREQVLFVDVRYEEDFALGHLPGAVNVPLRKLRSGEIDAALAALPARPIVAVCYDKRSSFYGMLLGLRLHRLGRDFRGRYTVPHEFTLPRAEAEWVARWRSEREGRTLLSAPQKALAGALAWTSDRTGLLAAILFLVLGLRAAMLPFSLPAELDQWRQRALRPKLAALKARWAADAVLVRRGSLRLLRAAGVSPLRNVVGSVLQLVLFALAFGAVDAVAAGAVTGWGWFDPSTPDATGVLPVVFGAVMAAFVRMQQQDKRRWVLPLAFVAAMVALVWQCRAAVQVYLIASIGLMAVQTMAHRAWLRRRDGARAPRPAPRRLVPLRRAGRHADLGNKAVRLGQLMEAGLPVPDGFVVPHGLAPDAGAIAAACRRHGIALAAVRSSAEGEDGAASSMAGMFRTELDVAHSAIGAAVHVVRASYGGRPGGVVVQAFQPADYAGVMFTADPAHAGRVLIELVAGGGDALVSGRATPGTYRFGRVTGGAVGDATPPIDLAPLVELGRRVERLFGRPQDIEWVYCGGRFLLVQSRDITRGAADRVGVSGLREAERQRLLQLLEGAAPDEVALAQTEVAELLPEPSTYSLALFRSLWDAGGSVDLACRSLGMPYDVAPDDAPFVVTAYGRCFVDLRERARRNHRGLGAVASFRLASSAQQLEQRWRAGLDEQRRRVLQLEAMRFELLPDGELLRLEDEVRERFLRRTYVRAETINIAAEFFVGAARRQAQRRGCDAAALLHDDHGNVVSAAFAVLTSDLPTQDKVHRFTAAFGHRAVHDFELAEPRYREDPQRVREMAAQVARPARPPHRAESADGVLGIAIERARRFQGLKEEAKHEAMRELAALRLLLRSIGQRFALGAGVFELRPDEVARLVEPAFAADAAALVLERRARREALLGEPLPTELTPAAIERLGEVVAPVFGGELRGECVAGDREVIGRVRLLDDPGRLGELQPGEILVTRCTDPCWLPAFSQAAGLVTEIGGWLSHAAIQAREHDLPSIVGASGARARLQQGSLVRLRRDGGIEELADQRRHARRAVDLRATLRWGANATVARVRDLGEHGARVEVPTPELPRDGAFELEFDGRSVQAQLAWVNCTSAGLAFTPVQILSSRAERSRLA